MTRSRYIELYRYECAHVAPVVGTFRIDRDSAIADMKQHVLNTTNPIYNGFSTQCRPRLISVGFEYSDQTSDDLDG